MYLEELIAPLLPKCSVPYYVLSLSSKPKKSKKIFQTKVSQTTIKTQHFITIYQNDKIIFGVEIFVYIILYKDFTERLIFVSKADTTGLFCSSWTNGVEIKIGALTKEILKYILNIPLTFYLGNVMVFNESYEDPVLGQGLSKTQRSLQILADRWKIKKSLETPLDSEYSTYSTKDFSYNPQLVNKICLFTRPEPQYLFPYSKKNSGKHILSGDQLLKWWCKIIDSLSSSELENPQLRLLVPGSEARTTQRYFPTDHWKVGEIFSESDNDLAIHKIPLFPDDPKVRFLEHLIVEGRVKKIKMKQFWLELSVRQEFRLGVVVGVVGVTGVLKSSNEKTPENDICKLSMKTLKKIKLLITDEDYSKTEELESFHNINKIDRYILKKVEGRGEKLEKSKAERTDGVTTASVSQLQPMMVIKRKKKKTVM